MNVGALNVTLGLLVDKNSWKKGDARIDHFRRMGAAVTAVFAGRALGGALLGFNMKVEDAKNQIAAMLALGGQTTLNSQLERSNKLYDMLRTKAADLPGETQDYVNMLQLIAQPMARANLSLEAMRDITSGSFVFAKGMGISWQEAGRDLRDFINQGKLTTRDKFLLAMLEGTGLDATDQGRAKAKKLGVAGRAQLMQKQTTGPLATEVTDRLSNSFTGRYENVVDNIKQTIGKVGEGLFESLKVSLTDVAAWFKTNKVEIQAWAAKVGAVIATVFDTIQIGVSWLANHQDILLSFLAAIGMMFAKMAITAIVSWMAVAWPLFAGAGLFWMFLKIKEHIGLLPAVMFAVGAAALLMWLAVGGPVTIAILALAAFGAALYVWGDETLGVFDRVIDGANKVWNAVKKIGNLLNYVPGISNVIGGAKAAYGAVTGDTGMAARGAAQMIGGPLTQLVTPERDMAATGGAGGAVTVNQSNTVTIQTQNAPDAKEAFEQKTTVLTDSALRNAKRYVK
jgi:uncharacterized protein YjbJ (UPF0337 family)